MPAALMLLTIAVPGPAFAQCVSSLCASQTLDQENLLGYFNTLLTVPGGRALLNASLQVEENIYLNATQAQKIAAGTIFVLPFVPANILIRAFPGNPSFYYDAAGMPTAPALPASIAAAVTAIVNGNQVSNTKPYFGGVNVYAGAYGLLPGQTDSIGNPPPYQSSAAIHNNPFTAANSSVLAYQYQQLTNQYNVNWQGQQPGGDSKIGDYPSAHTMVAIINAMTYAILAPGYYQQLARSVELFSYDLNVFGEHYPLDVIGGRILGTYLLAQTLSGDNKALYPYSSTIPANLAFLSQAMQGYLGGGGSSPYAAPCAGNVAACVAGGVIPSAAAYTRQIQTYTSDLTYGMPSIGDTTLPPVVPSGAAALIATRFPYLSAAQRDQVLATTELPSGVPLDDGSGWARLNLYAAASGYGAFPGNVSVTMNAALGGLNAFDIWSNNIAGPGGLTLQGSGTLILAGNDSYSGGTTVLGGTLAVTGTLSGNLTISPGATFVSNGGYAVAANATLINAGTFVEVNTPLVNAGTASNTGTIEGDVNNTGVFINNAVVTGAFSNSGSLSGNGVVGSLALLPGSIIAPGNSIGTVQVMGNLTVASGATYRAQVSASGADLIQAGGTATLSGGTVAVTSVDGGPVFGRAFPILTAAGGVSGGFGSLTEPLSGLAPGARFDALYSGNAISLVVTPGFYGNLAAAGIPQNSSEIAVGGALDAIRLAPGVAMDPGRSALFSPLYTLPAGSIAGGLDELAPSIYADALITARESWYLMAHTVSDQLAARRGLAVERSANTAPGPNGSTIWVSALAGYASTGAGGGSPGFTSGLGGAVAGIDMAVAGSGRIGVAAGTADGQTWSRSGGRATNNPGQLAAYGQWRSGVAFAEAQLGVMYEQENIRRSLPVFAAAAKGDADGLAGGGGARGGLRHDLGAWLIEPSLGVSFFHLRMNGVTETGGALAETIGGATLDSAESTLAASAQRGFDVGTTVRMMVKGRLGWSHEFADTAARISARFTGLNGSGFALNSAPFGRDAALAGLDADIKVASLPLVMFAGYGGAFNGSGNAQSFNAGLRFIW